MGILVREAMGIGGLQKSRVIAGHSGLHNLIEHVSVIEVPEAHQWFRGNELFLTAFYNIQNDLDAQIKLLERMKEKNVSALGLCYPGMYYNAVSPLVLQKADELHIPIIEIPSDVAYIDIISPILETIQKKQAKELHQALLIQNQLHNWLAMQLNLDEIIVRMSETLKEDLMIINQNLEILSYRFQDESRSIPIHDLTIMINQNMRALAANINTSPCHWTTQRGVFYAQPIRTGDHVYGFLIVIRQNENSFLKKLISDYMTTSLALYFSQQAVLEETKRRHEKSFIDEWFMGIHVSKEMILERADKLGWNLKKITGLAVIQPGKLDVNLERIYSLVRWFLSKENNQSIPLLYGQNLLLLLHPGKQGFGEYYEKLFEKMLAFLAAKDAEKVAIVFSQEMNHFISEGGRLYREVMEMLNMKTKMPILPPILFAQKLPALSLVQAFKDHPAAKAVRQLLRPLELYDAQYQMNLVDTLEYLLFCQDPRLLPSTINVHRNTLSYRRQRIREILSEDPFTNPYRINYELAILLSKLA